MEMSRISKYVQLLKVCTGNIFALVILQRTYSLHEASIQINNWRIRVIYNSVDNGQHTVYDVYNT